MRLGNRIYRVWEELELPKYFLKLHQNATTVRVELRIWNTLLQIIYFDTRD